MRKFYLKHKKLYTTIAICSFITGLLMPFIPLIFDNPQIVVICFIIGFALLFIGIIFLIQLSDYTKFTNYSNDNHMEYNTALTNILTKSEENKTKKQSLMIEKVKSLLDTYNKLKTNEEIYDYLTGYIAENPNIIYSAFLEFLIRIPRFDYDLEIIDNFSFKNQLKDEYNDLTPYLYLVEILKNEKGLELLRVLSYSPSNTYELTQSGEYDQFNIIEFSHIFKNFNGIFLDALISNDIIEGNFENRFSFLCLLLELIRQSLNLNFVEEVILKYQLKEKESIDYYAKELLARNIKINEHVFIFWYNAYNNTQNLTFHTYDKSITENIELIQSIKSNYNKKSYLNKLKNATKNYNKNKTTISDVDLMSGKQFEYYVCDLLQKLGFDAKVTRLSGDQGADIIAEKDNTKYVVQTKCYKKPVPNKAIQEVVSSMKIYKAEKSIVITNSTFTKSAIELANANNVLLWDREILKEKMEEIE